ncbi:MAG: hypothetical protein K6F05_01410 [Succinivibrio sp.]|nr:hypothetical protein [Succinivibrio sp.]
MSLTIAYIHGYLSSSKAHKATVLRHYLNEQHPKIRFLAPDFSDVISEALGELESFCQRELQQGPLCLVGSSMGGFMSTLLSIKFSLKACLFNPCIHPQDFVVDLLGKEQVNEDTGHHFYLDKSVIPLLEKLDEYAYAHYDPKLIRVYLESGDEVLDYTKSLSFFSPCNPEVTEGGEHRFVSFADKLDGVVKFFSEV